MSVPADSSPTAITIRVDARPAAAPTTYVGHGTVVHDADLTSSMPL